MNLSNYVHRSQVCVFKAQLHFEKCAKQILVKYDFDVIVAALESLVNSRCSTALISSCGWNHFKIKHGQRVPSLPRCRPHRQGHHISAGWWLCLCRTLEGSGSTDSCIKDNSGEEIYLSSTATAAPGTLQRSAGTADARETASPLGICWAEAPSRCCLRSDWTAPAPVKHPWSCISVWTGYGTEPVGGPVPAAGSSNVSGIRNSDTHHETYQHPGVHPETQGMACYNKTVPAALLFPSPQCGSCICFF